MSAQASHATPEAVLVAGSLIDVPVSIDQAIAVSARLANGRRAQDRNPPAWRIPAVREWLTGASPISGQLEVHFNALNETGPTAPDDCPRAIVVFDADGTVLTDQCWAA